MTLKFRHLLCLFFSVAILANPEEEIPESPPAAKVEQTPEQIKAGNLFAQDIMLQALELIGVRYRYGGKSPETGLDCSGFIRYVFQQTLNIALPHNAFAISRLGEEVEKQALKPGDLVFFNTLGRRFSHVGIYLGDERFVHAPSTGRRVEVVNMTEKYWAKRYTGARRVTKETVEERKSRLAQLLKEDNAIERIPKDYGRRVTRAKPKPKPKAKPPVRHSAPKRKQ